MYPELSAAGTRSQFLKSEREKKGRRRVKILQYFNTQVIRSHLKKNLGGNSQKQKC